MSYVRAGDRVIINKVDNQTHSISKYLGTIAKVISVNTDSYPIYAIVELYDQNHASIYIINLETIPPENSIIQHGDSARIVKSYERTNYHYPNTDIIGKSGKIVGYDTRDSTYLIDTNIGVGWFPLTSLIPIEFKGDKFYHPGDIVVKNGEKVIIQEIAKTKFGNGQLLKIRGEWVPSSEISLQ